MGEPWDAQRIRALEELLRALLDAGMIRGEWATCVREVLDPASNHKPEREGLEQLRADADHRLLSRSETSDPAISPQAPSASLGDDPGAARRLARPASDAEEGTGTDPDPPRGVSFQERQPE